MAVTEGAEEVRLPKTMALETLYTLYMAPPAMITFLED